MFHCFNAPQIFPMFNVPVVFGAYYVYEGIYICAWKLSVVHQNVEIYGRHCLFRNSNATIIFSNSLRQIIYILDNSAVTLSVQAIHSLQFYFIFQFFFLSFFRSLFFSRIGKRFQWKDFFRFRPFQFLMLWTIYLFVLLVFFHNPFLILLRIFSA